MMYTYIIRYLNKKHKQITIKWNCTCNDPATTLQLAKGACILYEANFAVIKILNDKGEFVSIHTFAPTSE